jgi:glyoxylase-like metal-dependent hydrolase (beta-lactamase superfamily II)
MPQNSYRFNFGRLKGLIVNDGFLVVPPPPSEKSSGPSGALQGEKMDVLSLYLDSGERHVLIDTGCGNKFAGTQTGELIRNLNAAGVRCEDIDTIIFTHGHLDHVAGTLDKEGRALFPRARYIVAQKEWQCWVDKKERREVQPMFNVARQELLPIKEQFHLAAEGEEIVPGIILTVAPGHTPGSAILRISSAGQTLVCLGDLVHSALEFSRPDYYSFLDTDPEEAIRSRSTVLNQLAKSGEMVFACHFPFPGLGYLVKSGHTLSWKPI